MKDITDRVHKISGSGLDIATYNLFETVSVDYVQQPYQYEKEDRLQGEKYYE